MSTIKTLNLANKKLRILEKPVQRLFIRLQL